MRKFGIELEFFVKTLQTNTIVPAYTVTNNLDGNPVVGEIRTGVHNNIVDAVFDLKKLLFIEKETLREKGYVLCLDPIIKVDAEFLKSLRKDKRYTTRKENEPLDELSVYGNGKTGKLVPREVYKAALQVNMSENTTFSYLEYEKITIDDKFKYQSKSASREYSRVFDYITPIMALDKKFSSAIAATNRVKGVYAIKEGILGDRIEYRSLPNNINLDDLIEVLK